MLALLLTSVCHGPQGGIEEKFSSPPGLVPLGPDLIGDAVVKDVASCFPPSPLSHRPSVVAPAKAENNFVSLPPPQLLESWTADVAS